MKFYQMGDGSFVDVAYRSVKPKEISKLQNQEWAQKRGGICGVVEYTEPRAIFFATF